MNQALAWLKEAGETPQDWDNGCLDFSDQLSKWLDQQKIAHRRLWLECGEMGCLYSVNNHEWSYHVVTEINGHVHDAWFAEVLPTEAYLQKMFPQNSTVAIEPIEEIL